MYHFVEGTIPSTKNRPKAPGVVFSNVLCRPNGHKDNLSLGRGNDNLRMGLGFRVWAWSKTESCKLLRHKQRFLTGVPQGSKAPRTSIVVFLIRGSEEPTPCYNASLCAPVEGWMHTSYCTRLFVIYTCWIFVPSSHALVVYRHHKVAQHKLLNRPLAEGVEHL